ncbi:hypothetical protein [Goodfellowiella coeruleoviolacea]|uniref:Uncharacterized protein n=1 Tax=Goodfellowiella coeruleoviolacea TaxID=334858 RepID=A0AAE3GCF7_9PSEU|nr:hypothetical protein [Goodfellowiella coeruleoviolacea]MCP2164850.1 hypothetical protein [Goodfellowiella coeruleoviolacea]
MKELPHQWRLCPDGQCHAFPTAQVNDERVRTLEAVGVCRYSVPRERTTALIAVPMCLACDEVTTRAMDTVLSGKRDGEPG